eukprot:GFUD01029196.1.p1 GENE.GFUD01029196.1~~GFUD01029196.1.p1  ORF type:complete len:247 (+),score=67.12 GFUD01029196.1:890-1630(+)
MAYCCGCKGSASTDAMTGSGNHQTKPKNTTGFCVSDDIETLELKVKLTLPGILSSSISPVPREDAAMETGSTRLMSDMKCLLDRADECADFKIVCEGKNFPCHEAILRARSPVLDKMFQNKMEESVKRELEIEDVEKDTIDSLLEYLYTDQLNKPVDIESEMIYIANKYNIPGLLELCFHKLPEVEESKEADILILADRHNLENFKKVTMQRIFMNSYKFVNDKDFVDKMKLTPHLFVELLAMMAA